MLPDIKARAIRRVHILEGQLRGIEKMIENEEYCTKIITQTLAVQKSVGSLSKLVVENHLRTHIPEMYSGDEAQREKAVSELTEIFEIANNRG